MTRYLLDTNVIIRYTVRDDPAQTPAADALFQQAAAGDAELVLTPTVLIEAVWVLQSAYKQERGLVAGKLSDLINSGGVFCENKAVALDAFKRYAETNLDIVDCWLGAQGAASGDAIASFDSGFKKFGDVVQWDQGAGGNA